MEEKITNLSGPANDSQMIAKLANDTQKLEYSYLLKEQYVVPLDQYSLWKLTDIDFSRIPILLHQSKMQNNIL